MQDSETGNSYEINKQVLPLFATALAVVVIQSAVSAALLSLVGKNYTLTSLYLLNLVFYLINPVVLIIVLYWLGRNIDISKSYLSVCISLFLGGLIGGAITVFFILPESISLRSGMSLQTLFAANPPLNLSTLGEITRGGFNVLFAGFFGIALANIRKGRQIEKIQPTTD